MCLSFLQRWLYQNPLASSQLVVSEKFYACRWIFDVLVDRGVGVVGHGGGELHVLLLHQFNLWEMDKINSLYKNL